MKLIVDDPVRAKYPDLRIGVVAASNVRNETYGDELAEYVRAVFLAFSARYSAADLLNHKNILSWQETYRSFGINPKKMKPSAEALLLRTIKNGFIPHINAAVDCYLAAEPLFCLPLGGYDAEKIAGDMLLKLSPGGEPFLGVGSDAEELTNQNEVIYVDTGNNRVLTRSWSYRDCDYTKIDACSRTILLFAEAPDAAITTQEVEETLRTTAANLQKFCGASTTEVMLSAGQNEIRMI